jgi:hypothetical protein
MIRYSIEVTDTFGGESNYAWVRRYTLEVPEKTSKLALMRRVKRLIGWNGARCNVSEYGDMLDIRPRDACMVCFVTCDC